MSEQKAKFRVLLGCADSDLVRGVIKCVEGKRQIEIAGWTDDGEEMLRLCERVEAELIVLDTELSGVDGLTLAFRLRERGCRQSMLLISAFQGAQLLTACNLLDVSYVLRKPIQPETLCDHFRLRAAVAEVQAEDDAEERRLRMQFGELLHAFHLWEDAKYCRYMRAVLFACRRDNSGLTKEIYPEIARQFGTTPANIERSIRYLAQKIWDSGDTEQLTRYFGADLVRRGVRPSNRRLIQALLEYLKREDT